MQNPHHHCARQLNLLTVWILAFFLLANLTRAQNPTLIQSVDTGNGFATSGSSSVGDEIVYRLQYTFPGITSGFSNVVVTDVLDPNLEFLALVNGPHIESSNYDSNTHTVTFDFVENLESGATGELLVRTRFPNGTFTGTQVLHNATMSGTGIPAPVDATPMDIQVTAINGNTPTALTNGVLVVKASGSNPVHIGSGLTYNLAYGTLGGETVNTFIIQDDFPEEFIFERWRNNAGFTLPVDYTVTYQTNLNTSFRDWNEGSGPITFDASTSATGRASNLSPALAASEYITSLRFTFASIPAGSEYIFANNANFAITGDVTTHFIDGEPHDINGDDVLINTSFDNTVTLDTGGQYATITNTVTNDIATDESYLRVIKRLDDNTPETGQIFPVSIDVRSPLRNVVTLENPVIYELLPPEMEYAGSLRAVSIGTPPSNFNPTLPDLEPFANWDGTGRTLIKLSWNAATNPLNITPNTENYGVRVTFDVQVPFGTPEGDYTNTAVVGLDNPHLCQNANLEVADVNDFDQDNDRTETFCFNSASFEVFQNASGVGLNSQKWVQGQCDTGPSRFPSFGSTIPGGTADYEIRIINPSTVSVREIDILDILPHLGDTGVIDTASRGSEWEPVLVGPVSFDSSSFPTGINGVTVYYSTSTEPVHDLSIHNSTPNPTYWSSTPPSDITTVASLLLQVDGILASGESLVLSVPMRAPIDAPTNGEIAWNSFGFSATNNDTDLRLLPTEPIKVGITTKPLSPPTYGNFVWFDTNQNGIQESTENGINGVRVELYTPSSASPDPANDTLIGFTSTQTAFGEDGAYLFPDLAPGDYYAVFYPPTNFDPSPTDQGFDDTLDSDGSLFNLNLEDVYVTAITTLALGDEDLSWDQGFFTDSQGIFLGDFVWADTIANASQDPSESGLGGVVVKLLDSGDNEIGSTTTSGNGFYVFGGPGNDNLGQLDENLTQNILITSGEDDASQNIDAFRGSELIHDIVDPDGSNATSAIRTYGFRFNGLALPANAIVDNAYIQFTANNGTSNNVNGGGTGAAAADFTISGELSLNPGAFENAAIGPLTRIKTNASVAWAPDRWDPGVRVDADGDHRTADLSPILQEIIDQSGWIQGNSAVILIEGISGQREAAAYEGADSIMDLSQAPELVIEYTIPDSIQIELQPNETYSICIDTTQSALNGFTLVPTGVTDTSNNPATDTTDSDAVLNGDNAITVYTPTADPTFNMSLDFGFQLSGAVTKPNSFPLWQATNTLGGANAPLDNPDGDLFANLLEYALCLKADTGLKVFPDGTTPNSTFCVQPNGNQLDASYTRPEGSSDLSYSLLLSTDGLTWPETTAITPGVVSNGDGSETVTYSDVTTLGSSGMLALQVTLNSGNEVFSSTTPACGWHEHPVALACESVSYPFATECLFSGTGSVDAGTRIIDLSSSLDAGDDLSSVLPNLGNPPETEIVYHVEIIDGTFEGHRFEIESATATTLTLRAETDLFTNDPCNTLLNIPDFSGDAIVVHALPTIKEIFPISAFQAGANSDTGDNLLFHNPATQLFEDYYLLDDPGGDKWVRFGSIDDEGNTPLCPTQGLFTHAKGSTFTLTFHGPVRHWDMSAPLASGYNLIGAAHPVTATPVQRNLLTLSGTTDPATADQVITWRGDIDPLHLCYDGYFYALGGPFDQWSAVDDSTLSNLNTTPLFFADRAALYCIRNGSGKTDYLIPSIVTLPANTRP